MPTAAENLGAAVGTFVDGLAAAGIRHVCACPGSRSTPLAIELARQSAIRLWMHLDERSAAYFGLGLARTLHEPVGLLATSGSAAANFFPAVTEAVLSRVPLVVLTADRPHELRDNGAAQTIDQLHLYGQHVKWFFDLPEPDGSPAQLQHLATLPARAVSTAVAEPAGPVHLNWPFRDPLIPARVSSRVASPPGVHNPRLAPAPELIHDLAGDLAERPRGVIVVGPQDDPSLAGPLTRLAARLGYPILADGLSNLRSGCHDRTLVVDAHDAFLRDAATAEQLGAQVVVRIGAIPTSKPLLQFLEAQSRARHIVVDPGGWRDPSSQATDVLHVDASLLCESLMASVVSEPEPEWGARWQAINAAARRAIEAHLAADDDLSEGKVFALLADLLPDGGVVYAGNSMPVRDLDTFLAQSATRLRCLSNRGTNGIDGVVSSALGASAAGTGPVVLVIGDISFYHDLNGLLAAGKHALDLVVVLVNNDGGGIFSFLPQADSESVDDDFELLFGTPHGLNFRPFVEGYGGRFTRVEDWPGFSAAVHEGLARGGLHVVEVPTERRRNVVQHRAVWRAVAGALRPAAVA
ncbi:MAG: 2-succinyl-5-enolpyruvyl-6-hydroxy-3-cyclohexene-1-carboxylic-acid synthase [Chloroflexi bacterium]|nr:2-succinyl-5-enolpyruvyl-6-hydroxy-3-cyclohexene-1-carboxylic-acid synthase [Chloroflexota bacterium]